MKFEQRNTVYDDLEKYCICAEENDTIEVTEWTNGEGYDITVSKKDSKFLSLTRGEIEAIYHLMNSLQYRE